MIRIMDKIVFVLSELLKIVEWDSVSFDANFFDELTKLTIGTLTKIGEKTVLELGVLLHSSVSGKFLVGLGAENVLISKHVTYTTLIDWHSLLLCEVHGFSLMLVAVLDGEILGLRNLSELLLEGIIDDGIHHSCLDFFAINATFGALALDQMNQSTLLVSVKWSHNGLKFAEFFFLSLKGLILSFADKVELVDEFFELWGASVHVFEEIWV